MFSEKAPQTNEQVEDPEQLNLERQRKKLTGFYLSGGDDRYIFNSDLAQFNESGITSEDKNNASVMLRRGDDFRSAEWKLLQRIAGPTYFNSTDEIYEGMSEDKHQKRILGYMTGLPWGDFDKTSGDSIENFLKQYPTPMDFDQNSQNFLQTIFQYNGGAKFQEYTVAMDEFQRRVYGKKYEYYKAMKEFHELAAAQGNSYEDQEYPQSTLPPQYEDNLQEQYNRENPLIVGAGEASLNKGVLIGAPDRINEDAEYCSPETGLFAVFDGAGGMGGAARASNIGVAAVNQLTSQHIPNTAEDLGQILEVASEAIRHDPGAGYSTGVIGRIIERGGDKILAYAAVGDSRIYIVRGGRAWQMTTDEGEGNRITNALGIEDCQVADFNKNEILLESGDRIVFCSDGITGDFEKDFIPEEEFVNIVESAESTEAAAWNLVNRATKIDDRTAIVVEV